MAKKNRSKGNLQKSKPKQKSSPSHVKANRKKSFKDDSYVQINQALEDLGLIIKDVQGDGNCLFRALSDQMFGNESHHKMLRQEICEYIESYRDYFEPFFASDKRQSFDAHVDAMRILGTFGDHYELAAFASLYFVDIHIYENENNEVIVIEGVSFNVEGTLLGPKLPPLYLAYHDWEHYSSICNMSDSALEGRACINIQNQLFSKTPTEAEIKSSKSCYESKTKQKSNRKGKRNIKQN